MCAPGEEYAQFRKKRETRKQDQSYDLGLAGIKPCRFFIGAVFGKILGK